jgi:hypothetical protein
MTYPAPRLFSWILAFARMTLVIVINRLINDPAEKSEVFLIDKY